MSPLGIWPIQCPCEAKRSGTGLAQRRACSRAEFLLAPPPYGSSANGSDALSQPDDHGDDYGAPGIGGGSVFISKDMHHSQYGLNSSNTQAVTRGVYTLTAPTDTTSTLTVWANCPVE